MKVTTESVLVVTTEKGDVVAMVRKDTKIQKNLIHTVSEAKLFDIESLLNGSANESLLGDPALEE